LPQQRQARCALVLGAVLVAARDEQVRVDRAETGRVGAGRQVGGALRLDRRVLEALVVDIAVVAFVHHGEAQRRIVGDRDVDRAAHAQSVVVADASTSNIRAVAPSARGE